uniref:CDT1 Geminin-binding domain-containing protein n=1 Tax=Globisporangium ultimum (strain ATCC 200006 / CBS 805.95 / DAOM BR144) TaxID=431595 RepID=K3WVN6_GLOUD
MEMEPASAKAAIPPEPSSPQQNATQSGPVEQPPPVYMPERLRLLITLFSALEFGLNSLSLYQHTPDFDAAKRAVEGSSQSTFTMDHLQQMLYFLPDAYSLASKKGKQQDQPSVLTIRKRRLPGVDAIHDTLTDRIDAFTKKVDAFLEAHIARIKAANPEITDEALEKKLENIELERAPVPEVKDVQQIKAKQALDAVKNVDKHVSEQDMKVALEAPVPEDLKTLPTWLIEKVRRQEQVAKKSNEKNEKVQQERLISTLPTLSDQLQSYSIVKRKSIFPMQDLITNLTRAPIRGKIEEQIHLLESMVPFWITVVYSDGKEYVKLSRTHKYNVVKSTLKKCIATSS